MGKEYDLGLNEASDSDATRYSVSGSLMANKTSMQPAKKIVVSTDGQSARRGAVSSDNKNISSRKRKRTETNTEHGKEKKKKSKSGVPLCIINLSSDDEDEKTDNHIKEDEEVDELDGTELDTENE